MCCRWFSIAIFPNLSLLQCIHISMLTKSFERHSQYGNPSSASFIVSWFAHVIEAPLRTIRYLHNDRKQSLHRPQLTCRLNPNVQILASQQCSWYELIVPAPRQRPYYSAERRARHSRHLSAALFTCQTTITPVAAALS